MKITLTLEHDGSTFTYCCHDHDGLRVFVDEKEIKPTPYDVHELGLLLKRTASFSKRYANSEILEPFDDNWFTDNRLKGPKE